MKQKITEIANSIGIEIIGFTSILDYSYLSDFLVNRATKSYNCEFEEQNINKRLDVRNFFPKCKSIIAIGVPYAEGYIKPLSNNKGLLSVSSFGEDYHNKLNALLKKFAVEINEYKKLEYVICVDTSPLIDKEICKNAGIGGYGKNTLLINKEFGSFINVGYLLTDMEIECSSNVNNIDICGDCSVCIKNCPNNAILDDGGINAKKCVSYLTQTKLYIPLEYRKNMRNQIYGCDVCQIVCPKNKINSERTSNIDYSNLLIDLDELIQMSNNEFTTKYGYMAGSWRGKSVWKRNALITIGNLELRSMFSMVKNELNNPTELIKIYAAWSLMKLNKDMAAEILHNIMKYENDTISNEYLKLTEAENDYWNL